MATNPTGGKTDAEMWPAGGLEKVPRCPVCGCAADREQAIYWLQKAAAQGNREASNKLVSLQK